jgi:hypothetical protein
MVAHLAGFHTLTGALIAAEGTPLTTPAHYGGSTINSLAQSAALGSTARSSYSYPPRIRDQGRDYVHAGG